MKKLRAIFGILLILAMTLALISCSGSSSPSNPVNSPADSTGQASKHDSITIGVSSYLGRFLAGLSPTESQIGCDAVFDSIFRVDMKTKQAFSDILESWTWTDPTTLVMKMKENVMFSNGDNATAEDLLFSYSNHLDRGSNYLNNMPLLMDQCTVVDKYTAQFKFSAPYPVFPNTVIYLVDKAWSEQVGWDSMEWYDNPIGSGPYKVTEYVTDDHFTLQARDDYWNTEAGPIEVREWLIKYYPDPSTMYMDLEIGNIQLCDVTSQDYSRFVKDGGDGFNCVLMSAGCVTYFSIGYLDNPIFYDQRIREAIALCADWAQVGQLIYRDQYVPADSMVPMSSPEYICPGVWEYNPDKAKELLAECGYGPGNPLKLTTFMMDTPQFKNFCESFQSYAEKVGIQCDIQYGDVSSALAKWLDPGGGIDFGFLFNNLGSPTFSLYDGMYGANMSDGVTFAYVDDPDFQRLMNSLAATEDRNQLIANSHELQQLIYDKVLMIPISEYQTTMAYRTDTFTQDQVTHFVLAPDNYQISRLGMASAWD